MADSKTMLHWNERDNSVKDAIQTKYDRIAHNNESRFTINSEPFYGMGNISELKVIAKLQNSLQKIYILEVGAGDFSWLDSMASKVNKAFPNKEFVLAGLNGENCTSSLTKVINAEIHKICSFKIEHMIAEFKERGEDFTNKFDFIISRSTLHHLADPLGTLMQMVTILKPHTGLMLADSFLVKIKDSNGEIIAEPKDNKSSYNQELAKIFSYFGNYAFLGQGVMGRLTVFAIEKTVPNNDFQIPLVYSGIECDYLLTCVTEFSYISPSDFNTNTLNLIGLSCETHTSCEYEQ